MLDYCLDLSSKSYTHLYTPDNVAMAFPFCLYEDGYFEANENYYTIRDGKSMYLLIYTVSGSGMVKVDGITRYLTSGTAVLIDCREFHEYRTISKTPWCFHYIHFDGISMDAYKKIFLDEFDVWEINDKNRFMKYMDRIHNISNQLNVLYNSVHSSNLISGLITTFFDSYHNANITGNIDSGAISKACLYIEENLKSKITLDELSTHVNLSKYYFIRLFQRIMGITPYLYIQTARINRAKELLASTDKPISCIAEAVGYSSCTRFSRAFFETTGVTPSQFRKSSYYFIISE